MPKKRKLDKQTKAHIERFLQGKEVWNAWAEKMLRKKAKLKNTGKWNVDSRFDDHHRIREMSSNSQVQAWLDEAYVDFSALCFETEPSSYKIVKGREKRSKKISQKNLIS